MPKPTGMMNGRPNDFQTPKEALFPLIPYLSKDWVIWECASGNGNLSAFLKELGFTVIETDIKTGHDFLYYQPQHFDCIITNPPYSLKEEFLKRCYSIGKPFALLLPLTAFEGKKRQELMRKYGVQVIFFNRRINFETPSGKNTGSWFMTAWFTNWFGMNHELQFAEWNHPYQEKLKF